MKIVYIISSVSFLFYLLLPSPLFPEQMKNTLQSNEPADIETPLRRSYFTDVDRNIVFDYYLENFKRNLSIYLKLSLRLNYPPEEAQTLIRDQTRSTYLEEVVHPFRESIFINGYEPKENKDVILVENKFWKYKITVRLIESSTQARLFIGILIIIFTPFLYLNIKDAMSDLVRSVKSISPRTSLS